MPAVYGGPAAEGVRQHLAREQVHIQQDRLLKGQSDQPATPEKDSRLRTALLAVLLSLGGVTSYVVMLLLWIYDRKRGQGGTIALLVIQVVLALCMGAASSSKVGGKPRAWLFWLGALFGISAVWGCAFGGIMYRNKLMWHYNYQEMRTYTNVAASQNADAVRDGGSLMFTEDTRLDVLNSVGYVSKWSGKMYCVAPLVDSWNVQPDPEMNEKGTQINFVAIGEDCCEVRGDFSCDEAGDMTTRQGAAVLHVAPEFKEALAMQHAIFKSPVHDDPVFIRWVRDPSVVRNSYRKQANVHLIWASVVFYVLLLGGSWRIAKTL